MTDSGEFHVVFGTGPVGISVMEALMQGGGHRIRIVNRSGKARVPDGVEVLGCDATDEAFAREASEGVSVVYLALNPPYDKWPELFPRCRRAFGGHATPLEEAIADTVRWYRIRRPVGDAREAGENGRPANLAFGGSSRASSSARAAGIFALTLALAAGVFRPARSHDHGRQRLPSLQ